MSSGYSIVAADRVEDAYAGTGVPGGFRRLTELVTRGTLTMRFDDVHEVAAGTAVTVAPGTVRSHRNEGGEPVEMWVVSRRQGGCDATKIDDLWEASPAASRTR
ncbi:MAG TPA: hypothetical protein VGG40_07590 [Solirubrobacterales bacterium]|jgi:hypothetical protein